MVSIGKPLTKSVRTCKEQELSFCNVHRVRLDTRWSNKIVVKISRNKKGGDGWRYTEEWFATELVWWQRPTRGNSRLNVTGFHYIPTLSPPSTEERRILYSNLQDGTSGWYAWYKAAQEKFQNRHLQAVRQCCTNAQNRTESAMRSF